jgi:predicted nucleotide-binding protein
MLRERFYLEPKILIEEASAGETVIEKFERIAGNAAYCIALMTPDDRVDSVTSSHTQARPNAIFELGWFYGRLGRQRVCILMKRGTSIHSDLAGIVRIEFIERVEEAIPELERELTRAGLLE